MDAALLVDKALGWHSRPISHLGQPCSFLISGYNTWVWLSKWINWTPFGMLCCIEISDILPVLELKTVQLLNWNWMSFQSLQSSGKTGSLHLFKPQTFARCLSWDRARMQRLIRPGPIRRSKWAVVWSGCSLDWGWQRQAGHTACPEKSFQR